MIEVLKQCAEDVSKSYDILAFGQTERALEILANTRTSLRKAIKDLESQEPVAWPCVIAEADFEQNTITLEMQCSDYKVSAGKYWLSTHPPQRTELAPESANSKQYLERLIRIMGTLDLATGHADTFDELLDSLESELRDVLGYYRQQRTWVGLADEQIKTIETMALTKNMAIAMTMATLKEKNT